MDAWNILVVVVLALILLLILPMVAARNGTKSFTQALMAPLHRKKKRGPLGLEVEPEKKPERHVNNSMQGELTAIVSQLITFTKRQHYTLVYPGTIQEGGQLTTTLALVVTPPLIYESANKSLGVSILIPDSFITALLVAVG